MYVCVHVYVHVCVCMCMCACACVHVFVCACVHVHVCVCMPSMDVIHPMIKVAATVIRGQSIYLRVRPQIRQDT